MFQIGNLKNEENENIAKGAITLAKRRRNVIDITMECRATQ